MISGQYVTNALYGAYRLARADTNGLSYFDNSNAGFWRSFYAAVLIAPLFLILLIIRFNVDDIGASAVRFYTIETILEYPISSLENESQYHQYRATYLRQYRPRGLQ